MPNKTYCVYKHTNKENGKVYIGITSCLDTNERWKDGFGYKDNKLFLYLTKMQDEVHRFAITYHRDIKAKGSISSILDNIKGIGSVRRKALLKKYKNINKIKEAPLEELSKIIPKDVAQNLLEFLNGK